MNVITATRTYKTPENATKALERALAKHGHQLTDHDVRWFIALARDDAERYVPTLLGAQWAQFAHLGIMVVA